MAFFSSISITSIAQAGEYDISFSGEGAPITISIGNANDYGTSMIQQPDGKILIGGYSNNGADDDFAIIRLMPDGIPDSTFDADGRMALDSGTGNDQVKDLALQSDGKIVAAGFAFNGTDNDIAVMRFNPDGTPDNSFAGDGMLILPIGDANEIANAIKIQEDGKIIVGGNSVLASHSDFCMVRLLSDGSLDASFDVDGILIHSLSSLDDGINALIIQGDGRILAAGVSDNGIQREMAIVRYNEQGEPDVSFDGDGISTVGIGTSDASINAIALQPDGRIVAAGIGNFVANVDFAVVRFNTDGSLDNTFDGDGIVTTAVGALGDNARAVAIQSDGKILVAGLTGQSFFNMVLIRYNMDGSLDPGFNEDGIFMTYYTINSNVGSEIAIQSDGKILVAGAFKESLYYDFAITRIHSEDGMGLTSMVRIEEDMKLYPNPFSESATFQTSQSMSNATLIIYNQFGQIVKQLGPINITIGQSFTIQRNDLPAGIYSMLLVKKNRTFAKRQFIIAE